MLKTIRVILAVLSFAAMVAVFVDFTGIAAQWLSWLPKYQLIPSLLALNFVAIAVLVVMTLLLGRVYCSVLCPLGIWQDIVSRLHGLVLPARKKKVGRFRFRSARRGLRFVFLSVFIILLALGLLGVIATSFAGLLDPYSAFGRMAGQFAVPVWRSAATYIAESYAEKGTFLLDAYPAAAAVNIAVLIIASITFLVTSIMAWRGGRDYCNTVCPVGTMLGFLSRFALLRPVIDTSKCNRCGTCGRKCKSECIDTKNHRIDYTRCVVCMDCIGNCTQGAISYSMRRHKPETKNHDIGRRAFLAGTAIAVGTLAATAADKATDGGLAPVKTKKRHSEASQAVPAGAFSVEHLRSHCTACQLCISRCPSGILKPSTDPASFMQPVMTFTAGYCRPECNTCGSVCPTGAITEISPAEKAAVKIGYAIVDASSCISAAYGQSCGNCSRHCPTGAITMVKAENGNMRPTVDTSLCIGCGSCEYHCPVGTSGHIGSDCAAIHVEGSPVHIPI